MGTKPSRSVPTSSVDTLLAALDHPLTREIETLRALLLGADPRVREAVKWNAPSFLVTEHFATFKLRPVSSVQIVFHTGAKARPDQGPITIPDPAGLLTWAAKDRCVATFTGMDAIEANREAFREIVTEWIRQTQEPA